MDEPVTEVDTAEVISVDVDTADVITTEARYVVGLDIGDGESCLAWVDTADNRVPTIHQRTRTGEYSVLTALARVAGDDHELFGEEALLADNPVQFAVNFKKAPLRRVNPYAVQFAQLYLDEFFTAHPHVRDDCHVVVGHPAGWPDEAIANYRHFLDAAGYELSLLAESRSALVHAWDRREPGQEPPDNLLVVDIGSSTTDFTFVRDGQPTDIRIGADIGCADIDRMLAARVRSDLADRKTFRDAMDRPDAAMLLLLACRRAKEAAFGDGDTFELHGFGGALRSEVGPVFNLATGRLRALEIPHLVQGEFGWADRLRDLLHQVRAKLPAPPELVIVTGGGSRMKFARDLCAEVFPGETVQDREPSFSVARGLASVGRHRIRIPRFQREMAGLALRTEVTEQIRDKAGESLGRVRDELLRQLSTTNDVGTWERLLRNPPLLDEATAEIQAHVGEILRPLAAAVFAEYGLRVDGDGPVIALTPDRTVTADLALTVARFDPPTIPSGVGVQAVRLAGKGLAAVAAAAGGWSELGRSALRKGPYIALGAAAAGGAVYGVRALRDARFRKRVLARVSAWQPSDESMTEFVRRLSEESSRVAERNSAPLVRLIS